MNAYIEAVVRTQPEQYYWVHRRFKTRPEGQPGVSDPPAAARVSWRT